MMFKKDKDEFHEILTRSWANPGIATTEDSMIEQRKYRLKEFFKNEIIGPDEPQLVDDSYNSIKFQSPDYTAIKRNILRAELRQKVDKL